MSAAAAGYLFRSMIFVPGNNPRFLEKAKSLSADIVCLDLEDSVPAPEKDNARRMIRESLESSTGYEPWVFVRTNAPGSEYIEDDIAGVIRKGVDGLVIPKVSYPEELSYIEAMIERAEEKAGIDEPVMIIPSIESAEGVVNAHGICMISSRVCAIVFGVFDLLNDMGVEYTKRAPGAQYSRSKIPVDARAAGVPAIDAIWQDLEDEAGLVRDCEEGRGLGYAGKSVIHPDQLGVVHGIFRPSRAEIEWAERVCEAYLRSAKEGRGATSVDGRMVDEVHYKQARALLDMDSQDK